MRSIIILLAVFIVFADSMSCVGKIDGTYCDIPKQLYRCSNKIATPIILCRKRCVSAGPASYCINN